jgi:hypothetical protein
VVVNVAPILCVPDATGVIDTEQVDVFGPVGANKQGRPPKASLPELVRAMVPVGLKGVPAASTSVTVTVTVLVCPTTTGFGLNATAVVVARVFTARLFDPLLAVCTPVPANVAPMLCVPEAAGVIDTAQADVFGPVGASIQGSPLNASLLELVRTTVPAGLEGVPNGSTSVTVTSTVDV